jgi:hypothetical protein
MKEEQQQRRAIKKGSFDRHGGRFMRSVLAKQVAMWVLCIVMSGHAAMRGQVPTQTDGEAPLTNVSIVKLVRARFSEKTVIAIIHARPTRFDLSPERLIELKKSGVGERIILVMLACAEGNLAARERAGDEFADDPFFEEAGGASRVPGTRRPESQRDPNEVNIFGSSGGVRGRSRSRIGGGAAEGESQTNGSASVRIMRPQAEAGGAGANAPRLERTPTLTNESVIELVEAGFSEGTILRRIESSPAEFDFSPVKLAELRRRRVGESSSQRCVRR